MADLWQTSKHRIWWPWRPVASGRLKLVAGTESVCRIEYTVLVAPRWYRRVAFGRVVFGMSVFNAINNLPAENQRPLKLPQIVGGGCVEPKVDTK